MFQQTGTLAISGENALDWFVMRFSGLLRAYTEMPENHGQEMKDVFDEDQIRLINTVKKHIRQRCT